LAGRGRRYGRRAQPSDVIKRLVSHAHNPRMDRCIDYIWISEGVRVAASRVCFDRASATDASLWPSDHAGVLADLEVWVVDWNPGVSTGREDELRTSPRKGC